MFKIHFTFLSALIVCAPVFAGDPGRIDATHGAIRNFNLTQLASIGENLYLEYPTIAGYAVNAWCLENEGETLRTITPKRACLPSQTIEESGVPVCYQSNYLTVNRSEVVVACAEEVPTDSDIFVCRSWSRSPAPESYEIPIVRDLAGHPGESAEMQLSPEGTSRTFRFAACAN